METRKKMAEDTLNNLENSGTILNESVIFDEETNTFYYNYIDGAEGAVALESFSSEYIGLKYPDSIFDENENCITAVKSTGVVHSSLQRVSVLDKQIRRYL